MSAKTAKKVDFDRLATALPDFPFGYLVSVDDNYRVHTVTVDPVLRGGVLDVGVIGGGTRRNVTRRNSVTVLFPPAEPSGYSLIVDGTAELSDDDPDIGTVRCVVVPTRALLHRNADAPSAAKGCLHDCVVFSLPAQVPGQ
ncbi:hypothetical protein [Mycobacterium asiaticum]|uniref:Pyridoxamine 5'-phosphate oxidase putative domain-containing protein n=1 Tax=Mycobacterium asiaticum TaxID=1790 RepID=A0A1A3MZW3_MYCAS|nr:hypothetical protein [Mycobacterium asiaticum]OBK15071.1 hypothetical protein A5636_06725 [Mycobacterium asiaticum]